KFELSALCDPQMLRRTTGPADAVLDWQVACPSCRDRIVAGSQADHCERARVVGDRGSFRRLGIDAGRALGLRIEVDEEIAQRPAGLRVDDVSPNGGGAFRTLP